MRRVPPSASSCLQPQMAFPTINGGHFLVHHAELGAFGPVYVERILSSRPSEAMLQIIFN